MKKRGFIILAVIALSAVAVLCLYPRNNKSTDTNKDNKLTDSEKFAKEYKLKDKSGKVFSNRYRNKYK